jgi:hypothetical protein
MAAKIVQHSVLLLMALPVLSTSVAVAQNDYERQMLLDLFETALLDNSDALWTLQKIFFNPSSKQSPEKVCLSVSISVDDIANNDYYCGKRGPAFVKDEFSDGMVFNSYYELHQQVADDDSDTQELAKLITNSGSTGVFYSFDPSFYSIMQTLSSNIALSGPYEGYLYTNDYADIKIAISTKFVDMPCWDDAVYALRSVLMWVSFNYII